jgi:hypothetical protein
MALCACLLLGGFTLVWMLERKRPIGSDISPDGALRADYSYRVRSPVELIFGPRINPRLILEIVDMRTGNTVSREEALGDYAELSEARQFFAKSVPWTSNEQ